MTRRLFAAELRKLATTRLWLWLLLAAMAITALFASLSIAFADDPDTITLPLSSPEGQRTLLAVAAAGAAPLTAVLGAVLLTGEFRHRTATATFLATPRRGRVVAAKLAAGALAGTAYGVACVIVVVAIAWPWLSARGITLDLADGGNLVTIAGVVVAAAVFAVIGVGVGAVVREQVAATVGLLVYLFVLEPILTNIGALEQWTLYLPGPARGALTQSVLTTREFLDAWQGGLLLLAYGVLLAVVGSRLAVRRDIT